MFCSITLVLSTLQENERLLWTQLNTTDSVGGKKFGNRKSLFFSIRYSLKHACSTSNLTKSRIADAMLMSK